MGGITPKTLRSILLCSPCHIFNHMVEYVASADGMLFRPGRRSWCFKEIARGFVSAVFVSVVSSGSGPHTTNGLCYIWDMTIKRLDHISVVVEDLPAAIAFFTALGMTIEGKAPIEGPWVDRINGINNVK